MALVLVACPCCANTQYVHSELANPFCAACGKQFAALPLARIRDVDQINSHGYELIKPNYSVAEDLFRCTLRLDPDNFAALIGVALSHQIRIESIALDDEALMAIGFYLIKKQKSGHWKLSPKDEDRARRYCAYLDAAIAKAPDEDTRQKLELYRKHNIEDAYARVSGMVGEGVC